MRKTFGAAALLVLAAGITGCAANQPAAAPTTEEPPVSANAEACDAVVDTTSRMSDAFTADNANDGWLKVRDEMDAAYLNAEGDVKERIGSLVDEWPPVADLIVYAKYDEFNARLQDIERACKADGADVTVYIFRGRD